MSTEVRVHTWWTDAPGEKYWLEVTGRPDIGVNLKAPQRNEKGRPYWSYSLLRYVDPGDVVFHYDQSVHGIVGVSRAQGRWEDPIPWAAQGNSARAAGIQPHTRPGWYVGLEDHRSLRETLSLDKIRASKSSIASSLDHAKSHYGDPIYFPFILRGSRPIRPLQGYLFKLPRFFVRLFDELAVAYEASRLQASGSGGRLGTTYRKADEEASVSARDPFEVDPALVERGNRAHAETQNRLAFALREHGMCPRSPGPGDPNFDLAWQSEGVLHVAEVKSLTASNEEKQLRLGLGQVLRYRQLMFARVGRPVRAVLATERQPSDSTWMQVCSKLDVVLVWPGDFEKLGSTN